MKASIIINNHNYSDYIVCCVESALNQTYSNTEIIIIDDGSTDHSLEIIQQNFQNNHKVKIISKVNEGQLSCFNEAKKHISGDYVFFLDADDLYKKPYVEEIMNVYISRKNIDFIFCACEKFSKGSKSIIIKPYKKDYDLGQSFFSTFYTKEWLGNVTSTVSISRNLFNKIFPIPFIEDWQTRTDDCLIWGASLFGARKYYYNKALIKYRVHDNNLYYGRSFSKEYLQKRRAAINRLFAFLINKTSFPKKNFKTITLEFKNRTPKNLKLLIRYIKSILIIQISLFKSLKIFCNNPFIFKKKS